MLPRGRGFFKTRRCVKMRSLPWGAHSAYPDPLAGSEEGNREGVERAREEKGNGRGRKEMGGLKRRQRNGI